MKYIHIFSLIITISLAGFGISKAQVKSSSSANPMQTSKIDPIVCYFTPENMRTAVPMRASLEEMAAARVNGASGATFIVDYNGFSSERQVAFQYAVDIWAGLLNSDVPIRIYVEMSSDLGQGTLASTGWGGLNANFDNAQRLNTWYVVSMAEKIAGHDLNEPTNPDITMRFNTDNTWYTGTDGNTPNNEFDLVSIALHEIAHGLGFFSHTVENDGIGSYGNNVSDIPLIYTQHIEDGDGKNLVDDFTNSTTELGTALTGNSLFFNSISFPSGQLPRLYAPTQFSAGSSIAHLNEGTYGSGNPNSLMTPQIGFAESIHDPGFALDMLEDMGWISMKIDHDRLKDTESLSGAYPVTAIIQGDFAVKANGAKLHYSFNNFATEEVADMVATVNPDEYLGNITLQGTEDSVSYYIEVLDTDDRTFTSPGEAPSFAHQFVVAPDTIAPEIIHQPLNFVFTDDPIAKIVATVVENISVGDLIMTYKINSGAENTITIPLVAASNDGEFMGDYELDWDLSSLPGGISKGDIVEYKLSITDNSAAGNNAIHPSQSIGFNEIQIDALNPTVDFYQNDFNSTTDDFVGVGFTIGSETGFTSDAIHSDHPYRLVQGIDNEDTVVLRYLLKSPIVLSEFDPSLRFDEVVLVEPGEAGSVFGDDDFWDYVTVEGSTDFGVSWKLLTDGYDSRTDIDWQTQWNSDLVSWVDQTPDGDFTVTDSEAPGNESLYRQRAIDMLKNGNFNAGDEILIRFKLYADRWAVGWGWAIDNLKIQVDDIAPEIAHIAPDYLNVDDTQLNLIAKVTDNAVLDSVTFEVNIDGQTSFIGIDEPLDIYELNLTINPVTTTSVIKYRIIAVDSADMPNTTILPGSGLFFEVPIAEIGDAKTSYINDFNTVTTDFIGSNFSIGQESGFSDPAIHSLHPYSNSPVGTSSMSYLLKYPITLNSGSAWMSFDEVAIIEPIGDRVTVEASKDNGVNWHEVVSPYNAGDQSDWLAAYSQKDSEGNSVGTGSADNMHYRLLNILSNNNFSGGDEVLIRFTMRVDAGDNAWGWTVDNLEIQGPTTGIDDAYSGRIQLYPNPSEDGRVKIMGHLKGSKSRILVADLLGHVVFGEDYIIIRDEINADLDLRHLRKGIYIVQVSSEEGRYSSRVVIK